MLFGDDDEEKKPVLPTWAVCDCGLLVVSYA
jgi:hypothetical protein